MKTINWYRFLHEKTIISLFGVTQIKRKLCKLCLYFRPSILWSLQTVDFCRHTKVIVASQLNKKASSDTFWTAFIDIKQPKIPQYFQTSNNNWTPNGWWKGSLAVTIVLTDQTMASRVRVDKKVKKDSYKHMSSRRLHILQSNQTETVSYIKAIRWYRACFLMAKIWKQLNFRLRYYGRV